MSKKCCLLSVYSSENSRESKNSPSLLTILNSCQFSVISLVASLQVCNHLKCCALVCSRQLAIKIAKKLHQITSLQINQIGSSKSSAAVDQSFAKFNFLNFQFNYYLHLMTLSTACLSPSLLLTEKLRNKCGE